METAPAVVSLLLVVGGLAMAGYGWTQYQNERADVRQAVAVEGTVQSTGVEEIETDAVRELRRATRDYPSVEVVDSSEGTVRLRGEPASIRSVGRALWARELSAQQFGQDRLAAADESVRSQLDGVA
jgi:uncharacterized protein HemX